MIISTQFLLKSSTKSFIGRFLNLFLFISVAPFLARDILQYLLVPHNSCIMSFFWDNTFPYAGPYILISFSSKGIDEMKQKRNQDTDF